MNLKLSDWADIAQVVSGVAVVVTLVFLIVEIRESTAIYEQAYFAEQYGLLGPAEWRRFERQICVQYLRARSFAEIFEALPVLMTEQFMGVHAGGLPRVANVIANRHRD